MSGKKPRTILTNQDSNISEAISSVMPKTRHRICVWHGMSSFLPNDFCSCIFHHEEEEDFMNAWKVVLDAYGLWENVWLNEIFKEREKWATAYGRNIFCADMLSAQLCEGFDSNLRMYLKCEVNVLQFFKQFAKLLTDWHYKESEANFDMNQHMPKLMGDVIMLKHARDAYAPKIFESFQQEFEKCLNIVINHWAENGSLFEYKVGTYGQLREYMVTFDSSDYTVVSLLFGATGDLLGKMFDFPGLDMDICEKEREKDESSNISQPMFIYLTNTTACNDSGMYFYASSDMILEDSIDLWSPFLLDAGDTAGDRDCFLQAFRDLGKLQWDTIIGRGVKLLIDVLSDFGVDLVLLHKSEADFLFGVALFSFLGSVVTVALAGSGGSGNAAQHLLTMSIFLHFALSKLQFPTPQKSKSSEIIYMHNDHSTNLVTSTRMARMKFCKFIFTSDKMDSSPYNDVI
ncbi:MULE transposase domain [Dillenia turbinata]|uniref:Protein FAR1-RELATED SEQUENCE n=1 Tax=Dillenia turbinata TaxID=194707 RepID=A0AAN8Z6L8_9MAGN